MEPQQLSLRDIHLPTSLGWWPPALGWWLLAILIPLLCILIVWFYKYITRKTAVKTALKLLANIMQDSSLDDQDKLAQLSILMRRVAISISPRAKTASLTGEAWLNYLDSSINDTPFTQGAGKSLAFDQYKKTSTALDIPQLISICENWIKAQKNKK